MFAAFNMLVTDDQNQEVICHTPISDLTGLPNKQLFIEQDPGYSSSDRTHHLVM